MATDPGIPKVEAAPGGSGDASSDGRRGSDPPRLDLKKARKERVCTAKERISRMPPCAAGKRSSIYRGVTRHRWTGRYEAHLWDKSTWNQNQNKKGKQVYLGAYDDEEAAARAYDLAALKYWGAGTLINFPVTDYARDLEEMQTISKEDYLVSLRKKAVLFREDFQNIVDLPDNLTIVGGKHLLDLCKGMITSATVVSSHVNYIENEEKKKAIAEELLYMDMSFNLITPMQGTSSDATTDARYSGIAGTERTIDLTSYIRWWMPKKVHQTESASTEDVARELKMLECSAQPTEPYKLPSLGYPHRGKPSPQNLSACSILSQSDSFKSFLEKSSNSTDNKDDPSQLKIHQESVPLFSDCGLGISGVSLSFNDLPVPRTAYQMALLSAPLRTNYSGDTVSEPLWTSLVPPSGQSTETTVLPSS